MKDFEDMNTTERLWFLHDQVKALKTAYYKATGFEVGEDEEEETKVPFNPYGWNKWSDIDLDDEALADYDSEDVVVAFGVNPEKMTRSANYPKYMTGFIDLDGNWGICVVSSDNIKRFSAMMDDHEDVWVKVLVPHVKE